MSKGLGKPSDLALPLWEALNRTAFEGRRTAAQPFLACLFQRSFGGLAVLLPALFLTQLWH